MENKEIRRANMLMLAEELGSLRVLADKTGTDAKYLSQVKNRWRRPGGQPTGMGDDVARRIEDALQKPRGWMDAPQKKGAKGAESAMLSTKEEMLLLLFRGLTPEQQREQIKYLHAAYEANQDVQKYVPKPLRTYSNEDVEAAFGKVPGPSRRAKKRAPAPRRNPGTALDDYPDE